MNIQTIIWVSLISLAAIFIMSMIAGFLMDNKILKIISFVAVIVFMLFVSGVLWMNK